MARRLQQKGQYMSKSINISIVSWMYARSSSLFGYLFTVQTSAMPGSWMITFDWVLNQVINRYLLVFI